MNRFEAFSERCLELANHSFSTIYARVGKRYWDNSVYANVHRNYCATSWATHQYEAYIPTFMDPEWNMKFYRIHIHVVRELDETLLAEAAVQSREKLTRPAGIVDSELFAIVAPHRKRGFKGFLRGRRLPGYGFLAPIITGKPAEVMRRLLAIVTRFLRRRIRAFLDTFRLYDWFWGTEERLYYNRTFGKIEFVSSTLINALRCLSHSLAWFLSKLVPMVQEPLRQANINRVFSALNQLRPVLTAIHSAPDYMRSEDPLPLKHLAPMLGRRR